MPKLIIAQKIFFPNFGRGHVPLPLPVSQRLRSCRHADTGRLDVCSKIEPTVSIFYEVLVHFTQVLEQLQ